MYLFNIICYAKKNQTKNDEVEKANHVTERTTLGCG
jgi:hypothetical protein